MRAMSSVPGTAALASPVTFAERVKLPAGSNDVNSKTIMSNRSATASAGPSYPAATTSARAFKSSR